MLNIIFLGMISFFMDISSEMVYSIILLYLTSALLPASVICGILWNNFGSMVPFLFGAIMSGIAAALLILFFADYRKTEVS